MLFKKYKLIFNDFDSLGRDLTNTTKEFLKTPSNVNVTKGASGTGVYSYRVSAVNDNGETLASEEVYVTAAAAPASSSISITWDAVTGANSYKVYGRSIKDQKLLKTVATNSFSDDGTAFENSEEIPKKVATALSYYLFQFPEDFLILSIPQLVQKSNGTTLTEGVEYSVQDLKFLKLDASLIDTNIDLGLNVEFNEYSADSIICLSPILSNLYFKIFGKTVPSTLILDSKYLPHLKDYDLLTFKEQQEKYADHLKF